MRVRLEKNPEAEGRLLVEDGEAEVASALLWWEGTPSYEGMKVGTVGDFSAGSSEAAGELLRRAGEIFLENGCGVVIGPMNRNTWMAHRHVVFDAGRGPFLMEPRNGGFDVEWWADAGFAELSRYSSSVIELGGERTVSGKLAERLVRAHYMVTDIL